MQSSWLTLPVLHLLWMSSAYCLCLFYNYKRSARYYSANVKPNPKGVFPWSDFSQFQSSVVFTKYYLDSTLIIILSGWVGARLFHVFYEAPFYYISFPEKIFYFWEGGFVYIGGLITAFAVYTYLRKFNWQTISRDFNFLAPSLALGYGLGRVGCYIVGCCFGVVPLGFTALPVQIATAVIEILIFFTLIKVEKQGRKIHLGILWLTLHSFNRLFMETFRADDRGPAVLGLSVSTLTYVLILLLIAGLYQQKRTRQAL